MKRAMNMSSSIGALICILLIGYMFVLYSIIFPAPVPAVKCEVTAPAQVNTADSGLLIAKDAQIEQLTSEIKKLKEGPAVHPTIYTPATVTLSTGVRPGLMILGMHRSGTSIIGGLINKMGLSTGSPLIQAAEDNAKGFFERIDVVLQNDYLMKKQGIDYADRMYKYDALVALKDILTDDGSLFKEGKRGLAFLNNPENYPWMLKDPRLCVTFRTWLPLLNFVPAVLFTYRHPMDVALSFLHRYEHFPIGKSLRMWYVYNKRAIVQSHDLCRVTTSHRAVMAQPQQEMDRLYEEIRACGVMASHKLTKAEVEDFVDPKLQHGRSALKDTSCDQDVSTLALPSSWESTDPNHVPLYREVMRAFCALEDGTAFKPEFKWDDNIHD
jgi:hypothetical protein